MHPSLAVAQPTKQLEDVLQDPDAGWNEIREAMRSQRGCTNAAIIGAIASGRGVSVVSDGDNALLSKADASGEALTPAPNASAEVETSLPVEEKNDANRSREGSGEPFAAMLVPLKDEKHEKLQIPLKDPAAEHNNSQEDLTNSRNRRPARRASMTRRGSKKSSMRWSQRRGHMMNASHTSGRGHMMNASHTSIRSSISSTQGSVNMMDFGVDGMENLMDTLNEGKSLEDGILNRRGSQSDSSTNFSGSGSGFLSWGHRDDDSEGVESNLSDLVDSCGFLDWRRSDLDPPPPVNTADTECQISDWLASEAKGPIPPPMASSSTTQTDSDSNEQWNIEDYENPQDNVVNTSRRSTGSRTNFFKSRLRNRPSIDQSATTADSGEKEEIKMDKIKEALMKVAQVNDDSAASSRRYSLDCEDKPNIIGTIAKQPMKEGPRRRQTVIGMPMPNFLRASTGTKSESDDNISRRGSVSSLISECSEGKMPALPAINGMNLLRRSSSIDKDVDQESNMWDNRLRSSSNEDLREAIWINKKDGELDIEKAHRKLYSRPEKQGSRRRATLLGLERPVLSSGERQNEEWTGLGPP